MNRWKKQHPFQICSHAYLIGPWLPASNANMYKHVVFVSIFTHFSTVPNYKRQHPSTNPFIHTNIPEVHHVNENMAAPPPPASTSSRHFFSNEGVYKQKQSQFDTIRLGLKLATKRAKKSRSPASIPSIHKFFNLFRNRGDIQSNRIPRNARLVGLALAELG